MIDYLCLEYCNENDISFCTILTLGDDGYYHLEVRHGIRGMYILDNEHIKNYQMEADKLADYSKEFENMKIYSWRKKYPNGYTPGKHMMGCDADSWSFTYKETEKSTTRHIHGNGKPLDTFPDRSKLYLFTILFPEIDYSEWLWDKG